MQIGYIDPSVHPEEHKLFHNPQHAVDGPCYAFLVHGKGPAVSQLKLLSGMTFAIPNDVTKGKEISFKTHIGWRTRL